MKLLCKKDLEYKLSGTGEILIELIAGKDYVFKKHRYNNKHGYYEYLIYLNEEWVNHFIDKKYYHQKYNSEFDDYLWDYFYTPEELRDEKIETLLNEPTETRDNELHTDQ